MTTGSTTTTAPAPGIATAVATIAVGVTLLAAAVWAVTGSEWLAGGVLAAWTLSAVAIVVDVRRLDAALWGPWYIWLVGAVLTYSIIGPLYVYDRLQHPNHPLTGADAAGTGIDR